MILQRVKERKAVSVRQSTGRRDGTVKIQSTYSLTVGDGVGLAVVGLAVGFLVGLAFRKKLERTHYQMS